MADFFQGAQTDIQKQQVRELLAQQTKQNLKKKEQQGSEMYPPGQYQMGLKSTVKNIKIWMLK